MWTNKSNSKAWMLWTCNAKDAHNEFWSTRINISKWAIQHCNHFTENSNRHFEKSCTCTLQKITSPICQNFLLRTLLRTPASSIRNSTVILPMNCTSILLFLPCSAQILLTVAWIDCYFCKMIANSYLQCWF